MHSNKDLEVIGSKVMTYNAFKRAKGEKIILAATVKENCICVEKNDKNQVFY